MHVLVELVGLLLITLTFLGSFRLARSLARPGHSVVYPGLVATTLTAVFVIIVDVIILVTGLLAITLPVVLAVQRFTSYDLDVDVDLPVSLPRPGREANQAEADGGDDPGRPVLDIIGHLTALNIRARQHLPNWLHRDSADPAQIEIVERDEDEYWEDSDD